MPLPQKPTQRVCLGKGCFAQLPIFLDDIHARSVFVVVGKQVWKEHRDTIQRILAGYRVHYFRDFLQNPKEQEVYRGTVEFLKQPCDVVVAIGGGSAIDLAKMIHIQAARLRPFEKLIATTYLNAIEGKIAPLIAVPTTAGTGTEATQFAVVYINQKKYSIDSPFILPDIAIIDPELTYSMPTYIAACTAADALCQAVESYWSTRSTSESLSYAKEALGLIWPNIEAAVKGKRQAKDAMAEGAHYAGRAINITRTTAPHAFSYFFTSHHGIPHGHAVALSLANVLDYNYNISVRSCEDKRGSEFVRAQLEDLAEMLSCANVAALKASLQQKFSDIGLLLDTGPYWQKESDKKLFVQSINFERLANNPKRIELVDLQQIFATEFPEVL